MNIHSKIFFILYSLFSVLYYSQKSANQSKIDIIDLSIEVPIAIKCENFDSYFKDEIKNIKLNKTYEKKILKIISTLIPLEIKPYLDTRYKGQLFYKKKKYWFCGDSAAININSKYYSTSPELVNLFETLLK